MLYGLIDIFEKAMPYHGVSDEFEAYKPLWLIMVVIVCTSIIIILLSNIGLFKLKKWGWLTLMIFFPLFSSYTIRVISAESLGEFFPIKYLVFMVVIYVLYIFYLTRPKIKEQFR